MEFTTEEIHFIGMNYIGELLQEMGYEFLGVNSKPKKHPQFVIYKKGEPITFVMVKTVTNVLEIDILPEVTKKVIEHAESQDSKVWFAGVAIQNDLNNLIPPSKEADYNILFNGFKKLNE